MAVILDPEIRIIPDDHKVFVLHPGQGKRFYEDFAESDAVFLDIPGIEFNEKPDPDNEELRNHLRMARRIAAWYKSGAKDDNKPSRDPADYEVKNPAVDAPRFVNEVRDLYAEPRAGDLIVIPGKGYNSTVFFGEFATDFEPGFSVTSRRYPYEKIPARRVNWLEVHLAKGQFPARLIKLMQNRQAIISITQEQDLRAIYEFAYQEYIWKETSGSFLKVKKDVIDVKDLADAFDLTNYFACQYIALKKGELDKFLKLPFDDAIEAYYDRSYFGGVSVEIHSPGYFGRPMKDVMLAGYVSAMLALSGANVTALAASQVVVENSANATPSMCDKELQDDIRESMEMYANFDLWEKKVCPRRQASKEQVGLDTSASVKP